MKKTVEENSGVDLAMLQSPHGEKTTIWDLVHMWQALVGNLFVSVSTGPVNILD